MVTDRITQSSGSLAAASGGLDTPALHEALLAFVHVGYIERNSPEVYFSKSRREA